MPDSKVRHHKNKLVAEIVRGEFRLPAVQVTNSITMGFGGASGTYTDDDGHVYRWDTVASPGSIPRISILREGDHTDQKTDFTIELSDYVREAVELYRRLQPHQRGFAPAEFQQAKQS